MAPAHQEKKIIGCQENEIMFGRMPKNRTKENQKGEEWIRNFLRRSDFLSPFKIRSTYTTPTFCPLFSIYTI